MYRNIEIIVQIMYGMTSPQNLGSKCNTIYRAFLNCIQVSYITWQKSKVILVGESSDKLTIR